MTRPLLRASLVCLLAAALAACSSGPPPKVAGRPKPRPPVTQPTQPSQPPPPDFLMTPARFADIPGWTNADMAPALAAFKRQCDSWRARTPDAPLSGGRYGGPVRQWLAQCDAASTIQPGQERWFFESYFEPQFVSGTGEARLTSYYEPVIDARRAPEGIFTEPLLKTPFDLLSVDLAAFASSYDNEALRGAPRALNGRVENGKVVPYPKREAITPAPGQTFAYAHPADLYNLQVQGSGRIRFPDGTEARAQFAGQNGYKWRSAMGVLRDTGRLAAATWQNFRSWLDGNPAQAKQALNADPSYVFFQEETIPDPSAGPKGAANVPLTSLGSMAIDPAFHPYGAVIFVDGQYLGQPFQRLMIAQDTGGAIRRGPLRGDVFWGSGSEAGRSAEQMNGPARWWTLLPKQFAGPVAGLAVSGSGGE